MNENDGDDNKLRDLNLLNVDSSKAKDAVASSNPFVGGLGAMRVHEVRPLLAMPHTVPGRPDHQAFTAFLALNHW